MSWRQTGARGSHPEQNGSRLREPILDPLEAVGFVSRGDKELRDPEKQEDYYAKIIDRYRNLQISCEHDEDQVRGTSLPTPQRNGGSAHQTDEEDPSTSQPEPTLISVKDKFSNELAKIITAMRKLREAMTSTRRTDAFALSSYAFIIRATILLGTMEAYHPALLHLLYGILPVNAAMALAKEIQPEFVGYFILDLACRQDDLNEAHLTRRAYTYTDEVVNGLLTAIARRDWVSYWRLRERLDKYQKQLCIEADERIRTHALDCLGVSYRPQVPKSYVEAVAGRKFSKDELPVVKPNWELTAGDIVVVWRKAG